MNNKRSTTPSKVERNNQALGAIVITVILVVSLGVVVLTSDMTNEMKSNTMILGGAFGLLGIILASGLYFGFLKNEISRPEPEASLEETPKTKFDIVVDSLSKRMLALAWYYRAAIALALFAVSLFIFFKIYDNGSYQAWGALALMSLLSFSIFPEIYLIVFIAGLMGVSYFLLSFLLSFMGSFVPDSVTENLDSLLKSDIAKIAFVVAIFGYYEKIRTDQFNKVVDRLSFKISQLEDKLNKS